MIDDELMTQAMALTGLPTKKAVAACASKIEEALRLLTRLKQQEQVRALRGHLHWEGDLDAMREGRFHDVAGR
jgi:Arc/MetJ family transcription regulator